jgi:hypothetical protein
MKKIEINQNKFVLLVFCIFLILNFSRCDLPVHCLKSQIIGKWIISASDLINTRNPHEVKCGHNEPSDEESAYLAESNIVLFRTYNLDLQSNDTAILNIDNDIHVK